MPDASSNKVPPAPSKRGLPTLTPPADDDSPAAWLYRLSVDGVRIADNLHNYARAIAANEDLTAKGQKKALAREVAQEIGRFKARIREEAQRLDRDRQSLRKLIDSKAGASLSEAQMAEWRSALRALPRDERVATLRAAAAGAIPASQEIMATVGAAASPVLLGFSAGDRVVIDAVVGAYREQVAGPQMQEMLALDEALSDATDAEQWLERYATELVGGDAAYGNAMAAEKGGRPLDQLTNAEKVARVQAAIERGEDAISGLFTPTDGEGSGRRPADVAKFAALSVEQKIEAVQQGAAAGRSTAEIVGSAGGSNAQSE